MIKHHPFGDNGDLMLLSEWLEDVECGVFIDYDGYGDAVRWVDLEHKVLGKGIYPSQADTVPVGTTHILWYNR